MKNNSQVFLFSLVTVVIVLLSSLVIWWLVGGVVEESFNSRTEELCAEYAARDHEKELAPDRWQWFLDQGINPNTDFDWYTSCINHTKHPVAEGGNEN